MNVQPVDPAIRRTVSNAAKSACELPYGPSNRATCDTIDWEAEDSLLGRRDVEELVADLRTRLVKPLCDLRMKTRSPLCEVGIDAMVAGCD